MESQTIKKLNQSLNLNYEKDNGIWIKSGKSLRKLDGILGIGLPVILLLFTYLNFGLKAPLNSISHFYYTNAGTIFTTILSLIAVFLIVYSGYEFIDFVISTLAGLFALLVVLLPTGNLADVCCDPAREYAVVYINGNELRENFHLISAAIFILLLAFMSIFIFTKSKYPIHKREKQKITRNRIYRVCGVLILISLLIMLAGFNNIIPRDIYLDNKLTFWMETLAVESFGVSWLIKGGILFRD